MCPCCHKIAEMVCVKICQYLEKEELTELSQATVDESEPYSVSELNLDTVVCLLEDYEIQFALR